MLTLFIHLLLELKEASREFFTPTAFRLVDSDFSRLLLQSESSSTSKILKLLS